MYIVHFPPSTHPAPLCYFSDFLFIINFEQIDYITSGYSLFVCFPYLVCFRLDKLLGSQGWKFWLLFFRYFFCHSPGYTFIKLLEFFCPLTDILLRYLLKPLPLCSIWDRFFAMHLYTVIFSVAVSNQLLYPFSVLFNWGILAFAIDYLCPLLNLYSET